MKNIKTLILITLATIGISACGASPAEMLAKTQKQIQNSETAKRCQSNDYKKAEKMLWEAQELLSEGEEEQALLKASEARALAQLAEKRARAMGENCGRGPLSNDNTFVQAEETSLPNANEIPALVLDPVFFNYNEDVLSGDSRNLLKKYGNLLQVHAQAKILISGHCDERGSTEYNLALGERRADVVKKFLTGLGVPSNRLTIISYGEEMPMVPTDTGHFKNRRAEFLIK